MQKQKHFAKLDNSLNLEVKINSKKPVYMLLGIFSFRFDSWFDQLFVQVFIIHTYVNRQFVCIAKLDKEVANFPMLAKIYGLTLFFIIQRYYFEYLIIFVVFVKLSKINIYFDLPFLLEVKCIATPLRMPTTNIALATMSMILVFVKRQFLYLPAEGLDFFVFIIIYASRY